jgi:phosphoglucosamine mutase
VKRLFGTDGIRGRAGVFPLDAATVTRVGSALTGSLRARASAPRILIGRDTRESGVWIEAALARSIEAAGGIPVAAGVVTTAGVAHLTSALGFDAGVMVSASHNPFEDNGIKVFSRDGYKLPDAEEARIEAEVLGGAEREERGGRAVAAATPGPAPPGLPAAAPGAGADLAAAYASHLVGAAGGARLDGMKVVLDCGHGAAHRTAPAVFEALGASVRTLGAAPDGRNINEGCGSLHPEGACRAVVESGADLGFAFDGDADRCILCDERGAVCDGDFVMWRAALALKEAGRLAGRIVVGTVMSNLWLERALARDGVRLLRAPVGDKYVLEEMQRTGARLGGEQSGHVIFADHATTGDGILTAVLMACIVRRAGVRASAWRGQVRPCPQVLLNVRVASRPDLEAHPVIGPAARSVRARLGESGRLLLRYSGTEPLARVMIEAEDAEQVAALARELAGVIGREIGAP